MKLKDLGWSVVKVEDILDIRAVLNILSSKTELNASFRY